MLSNVDNYLKILNTAKSCKTRDHVRLTFKWANKFRSTFRLTEFEYREIEHSLLDVMGLDKSQSVWNTTIDLEDCLEKCSLGC